MAEVLPNRDDRLLDYLTRALPRWRRLFGQFSLGGQVGLRLITIVSCCVPFVDGLRVARLAAAVAPRINLLSASKE